LRVRQLNIHVTGGVPEGAGFSTATYFNGVYSPTICTSNNEANPVGDYAMAVRLVHELAHNLSLLHTYQVSCCPETNVINNPDFLSDVFDVNLPITCGAAAGNVCYHDQGFSCDPYLSTNTCTNNVMGGSEGSCYLSPQQIAKARRSLFLYPIRGIVQCEPYLNAPAYEITSDETWSFDTKFYNPIIVKAGSTLTIKCKLALAENHNIVVEAGGKLVIDGGVITSHCDRWQGIEVYGNSNLPQTPANQGTIVLKNGAVIENAQEAIELWKKNDWSKTGGIIDAQNSTFRNNRRSIQFMPYHSYTSVGSEIMNKSKIIGCNFLWNDAFNVNFTNAVAITMYQVNGVFVSGSIFDEQRTNLSLVKRHTGIGTLDAKFNVTGKVINPFLPEDATYSELNFTPSVFKNLYYGVEARNAATQSSVIIDHVKFINNYRGTLIDAMNNSRVTRNRFENNAVLFGVVDEHIGTVLSASSGFTVEGNQFVSTNPALKTVGLRINNSGIIENRVYRNTFDKLKYGSYAAFQNQNGSAVQHKYQLKYISDR
jgi:hypothetical protein